MPFLCFKDIDVSTPRKLVSSACYDKQQVRAYLQLFHARRVIIPKITTFQ